MKTFFRILLAAAFSPIWVPVYLLMLGIVILSAAVFNLVLFIGKGEIDREIFGQIAEFATLRMFRQSTAK